MGETKVVTVPDNETLREFANMGILGRIARKWNQGDLVGAALRLGTRKIRRIGRRIQAADLHYRLDPERVLTKRYAETFDSVGPEHVAYGNYCLDSRVPLSSDAVIYSLGVGGDVSFDRAMATKFGAPVYLYDPTPGSIAFMELLRLRSPEDRVLGLLKYFPIGAWSEDTVLRFDMAPLGGSASAVDEVGKHRTDYFEAQCQSVKTMMRTHGHKHIDVLKMDIEGAAEAVMEHLLRENIYPIQLVAEFERPRGNVKKLIGYFSHIDALCSRMREVGYTITHLPRDRANYFGLELLFVRR